MSTGVTRIQDVIVPAIFTPYVQNLTTQLSRIIASGVVVRDASLDALLAGGGLTFNVPGFKDLDNDEENVSTDDPATLSVPNKIGTLQEVAVRLNRNNSWSSMNLAAVLAGADPMNAIANRVAAYWVRRQQTLLLALMAGVFADNDAAPAGSEHVQYDLTNDIKGASYSAGVTSFNAEAFIDTAQLMGDQAEALGICIMHSIVYSRCQKNNLIDFIPDSDGKIKIPTFLGRIVIVDDGAPNPAGVGAAQTSAGIYHTLLMGQGAFRMGMGTPNLATEMDRIPGAGTGSGQDILHNRVEWCFHPQGYKYAATAPAGGPSNAATTNNLAHAASWQRVWPERKQIKIARLITRES